MRDTKNKHVLGFKAVHDDVLAHSQASASNPEIFIAGTPDIGKAGEVKKTICDGVNQPVGNLNAAAFLGDVMPNVVKIGLG